MKQQKRKGFTLVELLIVIAILAVLATVSIVGYTTFIRKAHVSNDTALAKQINDLLLADQAVDGQPKTLGEALAVVDENGFDVTKLTPTALGHEFVYDIEHNRFALLDENQMVIYSDGKLSTDATKLWTIVNDTSILTENFEAKNSLYITKNVANLSLSKLVGVEVAKDCKIDTLTITDNDTKASVVLAGNIGTIEITAAQGTVHHYGIVGELSITAIAMTDCYHEHGHVSKLISFGTGKFVAHSDASFHQSKTEIEAMLTGDGKTFEIDNCIFGDDNYDGGVCKFCKESQVGNALNVTPDGTLTRREGEDVIKDLVIPSSIGGIPVTTIASGTFAGQNNLESVVISEGIEKIDAGAFSGCENLVSVTIPGSVKIIGTDVYDDSNPALGAFAVCSTLENVELKDGTETIGVAAFQGCKALQSITIPKSVKKISAGAFGECTSLTNITLPDGVETIGDAAFACCENLKSITIPSIVTSIGNSAFAFCNNLTITYNGTRTQWNAIVEKSFEPIPASVTVICSDGNIN